MSTVTIVNGEQSDLLKLATTPRPDVARLQDWLQASPYHEAEHLLDLDMLDTPNRLLALALQSLEPTCAEYATTKYEGALNWPTVMQHLRTLAQKSNFQWKPATFYVVEFRSTLKPDVDRPLLYSLDKHSHREAVASGGLLKYWYGSPDNARRNLATCLWRNEDDAKKGGRGPWHREARAIIADMYDHIVVSGLRLTILDDVAGWEFERMV